MIAIDNSNMLLMTARRRNWHKLGETTRSLQQHPWWLTRLKMGWLARLLLRVWPLATTMSTTIVTTMRKHWSLKIFRFLLASTQWQWPLLRSSKICWNQIRIRSTWKLSHKAQSLSKTLTSSSNQISRKSLPRTTNHVNQILISGKRAKNTVSSQALFSRLWNSRRRHRRSSTSSPPLPITSSPAASTMQQPGLLRFAAGTRRRATWKLRSKRAFSPPLLPAPPTTVAEELLLPAAKSIHPRSSSRTADAPAESALSAMISIQNYWHHWKDRREQTDSRSWWWLPSPLCLPLKTSNKCQKRILMKNANTYQFSIWIETKNIVDS